jgi:antitoxin PrlF
MLKVGERGRLVIPAELRHALGLDEGAQLVAYVEDERLVLEERRALIRRVRGSWGPMPEGRSAVTELLEERRAEAELEDATVAGDAAAIDKARALLSRVGEQHAARPRRVGTSRKVAGPKRPPARKTTARKTTMRKSAAVRKGRTRGTVRRSPRERKRAR